MKINKKSPINVKDPYNSNVFCLGNTGIYFSVFDTKFIKLETEMNIKLYFK